LIFFCSFLLRLLLALRLPLLLRPRLLRRLDRESSLSLSSESELPLELVIQLLLDPDSTDVLESDELGERLDLRFLPLLLLLPRLTFFFAMLRTSSNIFSLPLFFLAAFSVPLPCDRLRPLAFTLRPDSSLSVSVALISSDAERALEILRGAAGEILAWKRTARSSSPLPPSNSSSSSSSLPSCITALLFGCLGGADELLRLRLPAGDPDSARLRMRSLIVPCAFTSRVSFCVSPRDQDQLSNPASAASSPRASCTVTAHGLSMAFGQNC
jgi:hypothetical protein